MRRGLAPNLRNSNRPVLADLTHAKAAAQTAFHAWLKQLSSCARLSFMPEEGMGYQSSTENHGCDQAPPDGPHHGADEYRTRRRMR
jgi:hypothetical protein